MLCFTVVDGTFYLGVSAISIALVLTIARCGHLHGVVCLIETKWKPWKEGSLAKVIVHLIPEVFQSAQEDSYPIK